MDKTCRKKHVGLLKNPQKIKERGIAEFFGAEKERWECGKCGALICIHNKSCTRCDAAFIINIDLGETK